MNDTDQDLCQCGHPHEWHLHHRGGRDCGTCHCRHYQALEPLPTSSGLPWWRRLLRWLTGPDTAGGTA